LELLIEVVRKWKYKSYPLRRFENFFRKLNKRMLGNFTI
jgi:hypothetical protein